MINFLEWIVAPVKSLFGMAESAVVGWQERKTKAQEHEERLKEAAVNAKIKRLETAQSGDIAWENTSIQNSGWKDEWFTILLSVPAVLCFIPGGEVYVVNGFSALDCCPDWYQWGFCIAVGSAFGVKEFTKFMNLRKGD